MTNNFYDWFVIVFLIGGTLRGYLRGVVLEVIGLAAWILSYFAARNYAEPIAAFFSGESYPPNLYYFLTFGGIFLLTMFVMNMFASALKRGLAKAGAAAADGALGAVAGGGKAFFLLLLACWMLQATFLGESQLWHESKAIAYLDSMLWLLAGPREWVSGL